MTLKSVTKNASNLLERVFKIKRTGNSIDLSNSFYVANKEISPVSFEAEIYKITFRTEQNGEVKTYDLFLPFNELICEHEIAFLEEHLGILLSGDGSQFEILEFQSDFSIQFDQENSYFIASDEVNNGLLLFRK
ncbi:hypothetical protein ACHRV5_18870 [Flavobacterium sp. FlaQc-52]|jgi:hypothetical protein|uniref:hypothetical protein n=1 Tax=Flavobacterium sp. FlaQc-52 TaxID=3374185 RepID=UPI00375804EA